MAKPPPTTLSQILLHISPPPLNIGETREVFRAIRSYGEVEVFKVIRHTTTTHLPTPLAHIIFSHPPRTLPPLLHLPLPAPHRPVTLTLTPLPSSFAHHLHVQKTFRTVAAEGIRGLRATIDVPEEDGVEDEEGGDAEGGRRRKGLSERQRREEPGMYGRLVRLYTGGWRGFEGREEEEEEEEGRREDGGRDKVEGGWGRVEAEEGFADQRWTDGARWKGPRRLEGLDTSRGGDPVGEGP